MKYVVFAQKAVRLNSSQLHWIVRRIEKNTDGYIPVLQEDEIVAIETTDDDILVIPELGGARVLTGNLTI